MVSSPPTQNTELVPLARLKRPYRRQVRSNPKELDDLAESLRSDGQLEPVHLAADFTVLDGNNRTDALELLGETEVLAVIHPGITTTAQKLAFVFATDTKSNRNPVQSAFMLLDYRTANGLTWEQAAAEFHITPTKASRWKAVTEQPPEILDALRAGRISLMQLMELRAAPAERRAEFLREAIERRLNPKALRALIRGKRGAKKRVVKIQLGRLVLQVPSDLPPNDLRDQLQTNLFPAIAKAVKRLRTVDALPSILTEPASAT